jgi:hypothetical protein
MDEFDRCSVCARTPLVGERISVLRRGGSESIVCDLCLAKPRAAALGEQIRRDRVRTAAGADTVRIATPVVGGKPPPEEPAPGISRPAGQPAATG